MNIIDLATKKEYLFECSLDKRLSAFMSGELCCLIDSGAMMPVWCDTDETFKGLFPNDGIPTGEVFKLSGFGGEGELSEIFILKRLDIVDKYNNCLIIHNLKFVKSKKQRPFQFILPLTVFGGNPVMFYTDSNSHKISLFTDAGFICPQPVIESGDTIGVCLQDKVKNKSMLDIANIMNKL